MLKESLREERRHRLEMEIWRSLNDLNVFISYLSAREPLLAGPADAHEDVPGIDAGQGDIFSCKSEQYKLWHSFVPWPNIQHTATKYNGWVARKEHKQREWSRAVKRRV